MSSNKYPFKANTKAERKPLMRIREDKLRDLLNSNSRKAHSTDDVRRRLNQQLGKANEKIGKLEQQLQQKTYQLQRSAAEYKELRTNTVPRADIEKLINLSTSTLVKKVANLEAELLQTREQLRMTNENISESALAQMESKYSKTLNRISQLQQVNRRLTRELRDVQTDLQTTKSFNGQQDLEDKIRQLIIQRDELHLQLERVITGTVRELQEENKRLSEQLRQLHSIPHMLELLHQRASIQNIHEYKLSYSLNQKLRRLRNTLRMQREAQTAGTGQLVQRPSGYRSKSLESTQTTDGTRLRWTTRRALKAARGSIRELYGGMQVVIVGARNKAVVKTTLERHGVAVVWHDPFEESDARLQSKCKSADLVLICRRGTSHAAVYAIDIDDPKVQFIEHDNVQIIRNRVRLKAIELGTLIRVDDEITGD
jgi:5-methylcytosine-specific restriction endonuclease McrA